MVGPKRAIRVIRALESAGFKIVGPDPTQEMVEAACDTCSPREMNDMFKRLKAAFDAAPLYGEVRE